MDPTKEEVGATSKNTFSTATPHSSAMYAATSSPGNTSASKVKIARSASSL